MKWAEGFSRRRFLGQTHQVSRRQSVSARTMPVQTTWSDALFRGCLVDAGGVALLIGTCRKCCILEGGCISAP